MLFTQADLIYGIAYLLSGRLQVSIMPSPPKSSHLPQTFEACNILWTALVNYLDEHVDSELELLLCAALIESMEG